MGFSVHDLPYNKLCVIQPDKKTIAYVFDNDADAAKFLTPQRVAQFSNEELKQNKNLKHIPRLINKGVLTQTEKGKFYNFN